MAYFELRLNWSKINLNLAAWPELGKHGQNMVVFTAYNI